MRVVDLFCGAGGFSSGFASAGFDVVLGVDNWPAVEATYRANHGGDFLLADVGDLSASDLPRVDVVIGSPPCPEFSVANKRRDPEKGMVLVREYERVVSELRPRWFVMENVPPVQPFLSPLTYPRVRVLNAADYGVPQVRRRCLAGRYPLPRPTHARVPSSTLDGREVLPWVTVREAIGGLVATPPEQADPGQLTIRGAEEAAAQRALWLRPEQVARVDAFRGGRTDDAERPSRTIKAADVGKMNDSMYLTEEQVEKMRYLRSSKYHLRATTRGSPDGAMAFPDRADRPARTLTSFAGGISREGLVFREADLEGRIGPGHLPQELDRPASTIRGSLRREDSVLAVAESKPAATIAEPYLMDPRRRRNALGLTRPTGQNEKRLRRLTLRECARLQSFPDGFEFLGTKTARYRMVGNAVPPLLARRVAEGILREEGGQTRLGRWGF